MAALSWRLRQKGKRLGVVPTMGALHEGHASLIRAAAAHNDVVIVTIFVNPLQFGPREDFSRYPRAFSQDLQLARRAGADVVFAPSSQELYPPGFHTHVEVGPLGACWEGRARPGHFSGVATIVALLFHVTHPTNAYFGQKDYQQTLVVRRLVDELKIPVRIHVLPTVREPDGLALSSRHRYLSRRQRRQATVLYQALCAARRRIRSGERRSAPIISEMKRLMRAAGVRVDYAAVADGRALRPQARLRGRVVVLVAGRVGRTRLIDNLLVDVP